jgi:hypothetical protein
MEGAISYPSASPSTPSSVPFHCCRSTTTPHFPNARIRRSAINATPTLLSLCSAMTDIRGRHQRPPPHAVDGARRSSSFRQHRAISGVSIRHQQKVPRILGKQERGRGGQGHNREAKLIQSGPFCRPHLDGFTVPPPHCDHGEGAGWLALGPPQPAARRDKVSHPQPLSLPYSGPISPPSGGFVCGLQARGAALFCWPSTPASQWGQLRRIYNGPAPLADLAVGANHVTTYDASRQVVLWWRGGGWFPARADGAFRSLVSGDGFSCAVQANASTTVRCWGPQGSVVQAVPDGINLDRMPLPGHQPINGACCIASTSGLV